MSPEYAYVSTRMMRSTNRLPRLTDAWHVEADKNVSFDRVLKFIQNCMTLLSYNYNVRFERLMKRNSNFSRFLVILVELAELFQTSQVRPTTDVPSGHSGRFKFFQYQNLSELEKYFFTVEIQFFFVYSNPQVMNLLTSKFQLPAANWSTTVGHGKKKWSLPVNWLNDM